MAAVELGRIEVDHGVVAPLLIELVVLLGARLAVGASDLEGRDAQDAPSTRETGPAMIVSSAPSVSGTGASSEVARAQ